MSEFEKRYYVDRKGTNCAKWDGLERTFGEADLLPLWVADMDFKAPDCVAKALKEYADFNLYGYSMPPEDYFDAFIDWERVRHGYEVKREWMRFAPGVVSGIYRFISAYTEPLDAVIILTPCYYPFMHAISDTGRRLVTCSLEEEKGYYTINLSAFEKTIAEEDVKMFVLCSPHNPVGRVWNKDELEALLKVCQKHGVLVVSDEIHQDLTFGAKHCPTAAVMPCDSFVVTLTAASKTFNLAGLSHSIAIIPDDGLRERFDKYEKGLHLSGSSLGYIAVGAAYRGGAVWLESLLGVIGKNAEYIKNEFEKHLPGAVLSPLEGTYLLWIDLKAYLKPGEMKEVIQGKCRLAVDYGSWFYPEGAEAENDCHIRLNLATKRSNVEIAVKRIIENLKKPC